MTAPAPPPRKPDKPGEPDKDARARSRAALSSLPRVDRVAAHPSLASARRRLGAQALTQMARLAVDAARSKVLAGEPCPSLDEVAALVDAQARASLGARARPVINATGVILHTNLGRAPLSQAAVDALARSAGHYTSIEMDVATGKRGARGAFAEEALARLVGAEAALVVNNNAAAVMLALSALAHGRKVLVSRGELVEIGGGFRVPDVLARSGAEIVAGGTTNKPRLDDYARELGRGSCPGALRAPGQLPSGRLRRAVRGRRARAPRARARRPRPPRPRRRRGSSTCRPTRLRGEPSVQESVRAGFDLVCFSTDKALGGPQGGALAGTAAAVERARRDPLARALRLGRLPLVALEATLASYLEGDLDALPTLAAIRAPVDAVRTRAAAWLADLTARGAPIDRVDIADLEVAVGGGTLAEEPLPSAGLAITTPDPDALARALRTGDTPVFVRIHTQKVLVDARTVLPGEDAARCSSRPHPRAHRLDLTGRAPSRSTRAALAVASPRLDATLDRTGPRLRREPPPAEHTPHRNKTTVRCAAP
ncbi:MAG: hypothetical protein R3B70_19525 [Polyangiaceae bacterium]